MAEYIATIDQGTTGTRCMVFDRQGHVQGAHYQEHQQIFPRPGWVEHNPLEILSSMDAVVRAALDQAQVDASLIAGLGIANQRETVVVWDRRTGRPMHNAIVWQCTRTRDLCRELLDRGLESFIR